MTQLPELHWAPYREFGIPDPALETHEPPDVPVRICATGYRGSDITVYWRALTKNTRGLRSSFTGAELDALITTAVKLWQRAGLDDFGPDLNLTRAEAVALSKAQAVAAADWNLPDGEKPAEYLGTTADGGEEFRVSWADER